MTFPPQILAFPNRKMSGTHGYVSLLRLPLGWMNTKAWATHGKLMCPAPNKIKAFKLSWFDWKVPWFKYFWICHCVIIKIMVLLSSWSIFLQQNIYSTPLLSQRLQVALALFPDHRSRAQADKERDSRKDYLKLAITALDILLITEYLHSSNFPSRMLNFD